ncbi:MAG TPA: hypothetical protein DDZ39_04585 [Flavobacteriaceae bacterium]|jgi:hypothetical protein|nr:hypothetical protein [Flavobacteriaceae bacterium]HBS12114.1 hypothetical protein [Flavobacteriaceae bacterium]
MQKLIVLIIFTFIFNIGFTQDKPTSRFSIKVNTEYRITPIYSANENPTAVLNEVDIIDFNLDRQLSGTPIGYTLSYRVFKNFEIGFSHSFRYDHVYFKSGLGDIQPNTNLKTAQGESINRLITDYQFFIGKYFDLGKTDLFFRVGYSMMNRGTDYLGVASHKFEDGSINTISSDSHFNFSAYTASAGFVSNKFELGFGVYYTGELENGATLIFDKDYMRVDSEIQQNVIIPFVKLSYQIK